MPSTIGARRQVQAMSIARNKTTASLRQTIIRSTTARGRRFPLVAALVAMALLAAQAQPAGAAGATAGTGYQATILSTLCTGLQGGPCPTYPLGNGAGINDIGWIVGDSNYPGTWVDPNNGFTAALTEHATIWRNGRITDLGTLGGPNSSIGFVARPNDTGLISGNAQTATADPFNEQWAINLGCTPTDAPCDGTQYEIKAFAWKDGVMRALPTLGGNNALGFGVANDQGQLSGVAEDAYQDPSCKSNSPTGGPTQTLDWEPVVWGPRYGEVHELPLYPGDTVGSASAINDRGQVVGGSGFCGPIAFGNLTHALLWQGRSVINLGSLGGTYDNFGTAINNYRQIIGWSDICGTPSPTGCVSDGPTHGFLWQNSVMTDLGTLPGDTYSFAYGINDAGQVVGQSCDQNFDCRAFLWQNGVMSDLNKVVHVTKRGSFCLVNAEGINSEGEVDGVAVDQRTGNTLGFSAIPSNNSRAGNQGCSNGAQNATGTNAPNALSRELGARPVHRLTGLSILDGAALRPTVQRP